MRRRRGQRPILFATCLVVVIVGLWLIGLWRFAAAIPTEVKDPTRETDAIVVLTGGSLRVESGLALLAAGKARKLFVSGVYRGVEVTELLRASRQSPDSVACCIVLGHTADNTIGNARETAEWMDAEGFHSLRLVTGAYHMARSQLEFARAMPDVEIVPNPVFPELLRTHQWWSSRATALLIVSEYNKYLFARIRPLLPSVAVPHGALE
jgi:uncharacterized SAM-binding protein YcdF (DUF218 family)